VAASIDGFVFLGMYLFIFARAGLGSSDAAASVTSGLALLYFLAISVIQLWLLTASGQTIGKKAMGIRIVKVDTEQNGGFVPNVLLRTILNALISLIPFYSLVDILFIFNDRRCLHDKIAGTKVVRA
jgi:uncharacterized RDD family membrane protein YckC